MNKRFFIRLVALLMVIVFTIPLMPSPVSAALNDYDIKLTKSYNENGMFVMVVEFSSNVYIGTIEACLIDEGGDVYDRWNNIEHHASNVTRYKFSRDYSNTPTGTYSLLIVFTNNGESTSRSWTINHNQASTLSLVKNYKIKNKDGTYSQQFVFSHAGGQDMTLNCEIYTKAGKLIRSYATECPYNKGSWTIKWNYYPDRGLKMKSGTYIIKYWLGDGNPKQTTVNLKI